MELASKQAQAERVFSVCNIKKNYEQEIGLTSFKHYAVSTWVKAVHGTKIMFCNIDVFMYKKTEGEEQQNREI